MAEKKKVSISPKDRKVIVISKKLSVGKENK